MNHLMRSMKCLCYALIMASLGLLCSASFAQQVKETTRADVLLIDRIKATQKVSVQQPRHGMSMLKVEAQFGAPNSKSLPVGNGSHAQPPITRWVYPEFTVYFEHTQVIATVINRANPLELGPKPPHS